MKLVLDLGKRHFTLRRGPLTFIGTWLRMDDDQWRQCLAIIRTDEEGKDDALPCVVTLDKAWIWSEEIGDPRQSAITAFHMCERLRISTVDKGNIRRLAGWIIDCVGDLLDIPPAPPGTFDTEVIAEAVLTDPRTGKTYEREIRDV